MVYFRQEFTVTNKKLAAGGMEKNKTYPKT